MTSWKDSSTSTKAWSCLQSWLTEIEVDELDPVLELAVQRYDLDVVPYEITPAMIKDAILELEEYNKKRA